MSKPRQLRDVDLMKLLLDPRRSRILELAADAPVSVNELAEQLGELSSRVYYHVHKLEEAGLLELVDTRQHGNLIEKLYQCKVRDLKFSLDPAAFEHVPALTQEFEQVVIPGLRLIEHTAKLRAERAKTNPEDTRRSDDPQVRMSISWDTMTESEWRAKVGKMIHGINEDDNDVSEPNESNGPLHGESSEKQHRYAFVILSYRLEDAEALGFFQNVSAENKERRT